MLRLLNGSHFLLLLSINHHTRYNILQTNRASNILFIIFHLFLKKGSNNLSTILKNARKLNYIPSSIITYHYRHQISHSVSIVRGTIAQRPKHPTGEGKSKPGPSYFAICLGPYVPNISIFIRIISSPFLRMHLTLKNKY